MKNIKINKRFYNIVSPLLSNSLSNQHKNTLIKLNINSTIANKFCSSAREIKSAPYDGILYKDHSKYLTEVTLNQPKKLNSLDLKMIRNLLRKVRQWVPYNIDGFSSDSTEPSEQIKPKVIMFTGNGKSFCSGGDINALYNAKKDSHNSTDKKIGIGLSSNQKILKDFFRYEYLLDYSLTRMDPIQIAFWHGAVMGGGVGISINAPFRICTEDTSFAMPESKIGLFTDVGASYFLPRFLNNSPELGLFMGLTGHRISGKELAITGIATHYINKEGFENLKKVLIDKVDDGINRDTLKKIIADNTEISFNPNKFDFPEYNNIKYVFRPDSLDNIFKRLNSLVNGDISNIINENNDDKELINSTKNLNLNEDTKVWGEKYIKILNKMSPLSLTVIMEQIKRGLNMNSIEEAYNLEAQIAAGFMEESDFFEGVRALLIDKDNNPKWMHKSYKDVDFNNMINKYFDRTEEIDVETKL